MKTVLSAAALLSAASGALAQYQLAQEYAGKSFFDRWDFYGAYDNLTNGDVTFVTRANATSGKLAYVDDSGHAIIKVDTGNVVYNEKRNSVRIESSDAYSIGSIWVIDINHLPYGCSVWPAFWTAGNKWPEGGEIDIIEQINLASQNQMALHADKGCVKASGGAAQSGTDGDGDCGTAAGCTVTEKSTSSFGEAFAKAGGGVWATQFAENGINIWFWNRADIPSSLSASDAPKSVDVSTWGTPSAAFPSSGCDISKYFGPQRLILDITLCGDWAGTPSVYNASSCYTSAGTNGVCYLDNVINDGSTKYANAYFDISYIRAYTLPNATISSAASSGTGSASGSGPSASATGTTPNGAASRALGTAGMWAAVSAVAGAAVGVAALL